MTSVNNFVHDRALLSLPYSAADKFDCGLMQIGGEELRSADSSGGLYYRSNQPAP